MSEKFEISLRSKSAEQLINMSQNKTQWSEIQMKLIKSEIKKRELEIFEEPEPWREDVPSVSNSESDFEKDLKIIKELDNKKSLVSNFQLVAQIVSISAMIIILLIGLFIRDKDEVIFGVTILGTFMSLGLFITKKYTASLIFGGAALLLDLIMLLFFLKENI